MRRVLVVVLIACGGAPPAGPVVRNEPDAVIARTRMPTHFNVAISRPDIDIQPYVPDLHEDLRWPLSGMEHPKLEPSFPIAIALAAPGVGWLDLCAMGAQNRHVSREQELVSYLRGWCSVIKGDVDRACQELTPLFGSVTRGLSSAVRTDLANILVDLRDLEKTEHWLNKHRIRDIATLDLLAANFVEIGMLDAAHQINQRVLYDFSASVATRCHRLVRGIVMADGADQSARDELERIVTKSKAPDATCTELFNEVRCAYGHDCAEYHTAHNINLNAWALLAVYDRWPLQPAPFSTWLSLGRKAAIATKVDGAAELVVTAYEAALRAKPDLCDDLDIRAELRVDMKAIRDSAPHAAALEPRVANLLQLCGPAPQTAR